MKINFTKFLPFESYTLTSTLNIDQILERISENIEPKHGFSFSFINNSTTKPYQGEISGNTFKIYRVIHYRNSFLPFITGHTSSYLGKTLIKIKMRPFMVVIIFMCYWLSFFVPMCLSFLSNAVFKSKKVIQNDFPFSTYIPFLFVLFGWCLMFFAFKSESKKSKQFLASLLQGEETNGYHIYSG